MAGRSESYGSSDQRQIADLTSQLATTTAELARVRERAERAVRAKGDFLSRISHELRTPLNAILGFAQMMELEEVPPLQRESLDHILRAGQHLLALVNQILDVARLETRQLEFRLEAIPVASLLHDAFALVQPLAARQQIVMQPLSPEISDELFIHADRDRLKHALVELLTNAIKFNRQGGEVSAQVASSAERVRLTVTDQGPGLHPEEIAGLFVPFQRLGNVQPEIEGAGVGLVLAQGMVKAMQGTISVESTPGGGAAFTLDLPRAPSPLTPAAAPPSITSSAPARLLLCIEDDPTNARLVEVFLRGDRNIKVMGAADGSSGLKLAADLQPDLIVTDMNLPDMSGHDVLARLKQEPATRSIPVICVSANEDPAEVRRALAGGAIRYLPKPINRNSFVTLVGSILQA